MISTTFTISAQTQQAAGTPNWSTPENIIGPNDGNLMTATINNSQTSQKLRMSVSVPAGLQSSRYHGCKLVFGGFTSPGYTTQGGGISIRMLTAANAEVGTAIARPLDPASTNGFHHESNLSGFADNLTTAQIDTLANLGGVSMLAFCTVGTGYNFSLDSFSLLVQHSAPILTCAHTQTVNMAVAASGAGTGTTAWASPTNAQGAANASYTTCTTTNDGVVGQMDSQELQMSISAGALAALSMVYPKQMRFHVKAVLLSDLNSNGMDVNEFSTNPSANIRLTFRDSGGSVISVTPMEGEIEQIGIGFTNRRDYTFTVQNQDNITALKAALDAGGKICIKFIGDLPPELAQAPANIRYSVDTVELEMGWDDSVPPAAGSGAGFHQAASMLDSLLVIIDEDMLEQLEKDNKK